MTADPKIRALDTLWERVRSDPTDDTAHEKLINFAVQNDLFVPLLNRYKTLEDSGHQAIAEKWKKKIADRAMAKIFTTAAAKKPQPSKTKSRLGSVLIVAGTTQMIIASSTVTRALGLIFIIAGFGLVFLARGRAE